MRRLREGELKIVLWPALGVFTIIMVLGFALLLNGQKKGTEDLLHQIVVNQNTAKEILRNQTVADENRIKVIICILTVPPPERTDATISKCAEQAERTPNP